MEGSRDKAYRMEGNRDQTYKMERNRDPTYKMEASQRIEKLLVDGRSISHDSHETFTSKIDGHINHKLAEQGRIFFRANFFSVFVGMLSGLLTLMFIKSIVSVLAFTKKSHTGILAFRRYLNTLLHIRLWYEDLDQMKSSLKSVRLQHKAAAVKFSAAVGSGHIGISQFDMVVTQWAFIGPLLLFPSKLGISSTSSLEGMVHIMYLVGKELGVADDMNLCSGGLDEARNNSREIFLQVIQPAIKENMRDEKCSSMASALLTGVNVLNPFIDPTAFRRFTLEMFMVENDEEKELVGYSAVTKAIMDLVFHRLMHVPVVGEVVRVAANLLMRLDVFLASDWTDFIVANFKADHVTPRDRIQAFLAIPLFTAVSGVGFVWRNANMGVVVMAIMALVCFFSFLL